VTAQGPAELLPKAVSCRGPVLCTAAGQVTGVIGDGSQIAERWDGKAWLPQRVPLPPGTAFVPVTTVSCATTTSCQLVGAYVGADGTTTGGLFADGWDGSRWSSETLAAMPNMLNLPVITGVSCASPSVCEAVGQGGGGPPIVGKGSPLVGSGALVEGWDGRSWLRQHAPVPDAIDLGAVSCPSSMFCEAVGTQSAGVAAVET